MNTFIAVAVAVIRNSKGEFLLTQRFSPEYPEVHLKWQLVGGGIEFGETPDDAVKRECQEEIGCQVEPVVPYPVIRTHIWRHTGQDPQHTLIIAYLCELKDETQQIVLNEESYSHRWFTFDQLEKLDILPQTVGIIEEFKSYGQKLLHR